MRTVDRQRRPSDGFPELEFDEEEKTRVDPPVRTRTPTPARPLETLPGFEPGREVGRREGRRAGVILACDKFLEAWLSNPKNDVGMAHLVVQKLARDCGVELPAALPGARRVSGAAPAGGPSGAAAGEMGAARPPPPAGRRGR